MRLGIDLGGTKIEIIALDDNGQQTLRRRIATPQNNYQDIVYAIRDLVLSAEQELAKMGSVGVAIPGSISRKTGLVKNANSTRLIGHPLDRDLAEALHRPIRVANDANCFTLSEAADGAGRGADLVFGIIAGTGIGGGLCNKGSLIEGEHSIAGEWGHNPLPSPNAEELELTPKCYCGKTSCIEAWCSGPAITAEYHRQTGEILKASEITALNSTASLETMERFYDRFARSIAMLVNILDPDAIVLGGGVSNIERLYETLPARVESYAFTPEEPIRILKNMHGDSSGVRGAAWLWRADEVAQALPQ